MFLLQVEKEIEYQLFRLYYNESDIKHYENELERKRRDVEKLEKKKEKAEEQLKDKKKDQGKLNKELSKIEQEIREAVRLFFCLDFNLGYSLYKKLKFKLDFPNSEKIGIKTLKYCYGTRKACGECDEFYQLKTLLLSYCDQYYVSSEIKLKSYVYYRSIANFLFPIGLDKELIVELILA